MSKAILLAGAQAVLAEAMALPVPDVPLPPGAVVLTLSPPIDTTRFFCLVEDFAGNEQYERFQREIEINSSRSYLDAHTTQIGGAIFPLDFPRYEMYFDGVLVSTYLRTGSEKVARFMLPRPLPPGRRLRDVTFVIRNAAGAVVGQSTIPTQVIDNQDGKAHLELTEVGVRNTSHDWHLGKKFRANARVPLAMAQPRAVPRRIAPAVEFTNQPAGNQLVREMVVAACATTNDMTTHYLGRKLSGVYTAANSQGYTGTNLFRAYPEHSRLDGPRGISTVYYPLSIKPGRDDRAHLTDSYAMFKITADGTKLTRFGLRHKWPIYWAEASLTHPAIEFVGNCLDPSIPQHERFPYMTWSWDFDPDSLRLSGTRPPVGGLPPHVGDVRWHQTDKRGWLWECTTPGDQFEGPVSFRRPLVGLNRPFASRHIPGRVLLIAEEGAKHVSRWDADNYRSLGLEVEGLPHPVQDLVVFDGFLYFSMFERAPGVLVGQVCRKPLNTAPTAPYEVVFRPVLNTSNGVGSLFLSFAINDNTLDAEGRRPKGGAGPHGMIAMSPFNNEVGYGRPQFAVPDSAGRYVPWNNWNVYGYNTIQGRGPVYPNDVYPTAQGFGYGRWWYGGSTNSLYVHRLANAGDPPATSAAAQRGHQKYVARGLDLIHGIYGHAGLLPPPWGVDPEIDAMLIAAGHVKAA